MKIAKTVVILFLSQWLIHGFASSAQEPPLSLPWYAHQAKQKGLTEIEGAVPMHGVTSMSLDYLSKHSLLVEARVESATEDASDGIHIFTWYKLKVLSSAGHPIARDIPAARRQSFGAKLPQSLSALNQSELLFQETGGTATYDGIKVTIPVYYNLTLGKRYLLFLEPITDVGSISAEEHAKDKAFREAWGSHPISLDSKGTILDSLNLWNEGPSVIFRTAQQLITYFANTRTWKPSDEVR